MSRAGGCIRDNYDMWPSLRNRKKMKEKSVKRFDFVRNDRTIEFFFPAACSFLFLYNLQDSKELLNCAESFSTIFRTVFAVVFYSLNYYYNSQKLLKYIYTVVKERPEKLKLYRSSNVQAFVSLLLWQHSKTAKTNNIKFGPSAVQ